MRNPGDVPSFGLPFQHTWRLRLCPAGRWPSIGCSRERHAGRGQAMSAGEAKPGRADYGIDAPHVVRNLALIGVACVALAAVTVLALEPSQPALAAMLFNMGLWPGVTFLLTAGVMLWGSKVGKLRMRDRLLDGIPWRGDEQVLDVGC